MEYLAKHWGLDVTQQQRIQKALKAAVYSLLIVNFFVYFYQDSVNASAVLADDYSLIELLAAFTTTIDDFAWLLLIAVLELETYQISDERWNRKWAISLRAVRALCYLFIAHTVYSYSGALIDSYNVPFALSEGLSACDFADHDIYWFSMLTYEPITAANCASFADANLWQTSGENIISDAEGVKWEWIFAHVDLFESLSWLTIMAAIEINVAYANKGQTHHLLAKVMRIASFAAYGLIVVFSIMWIWAGFPEWAWDEFVWIAGFAIIEMNVSEWQEEIEENEENA